MRFKEGNITDLIASAIALLPYFCTHLSQLPNQNNDLLFLMTTRHSLVDNASHLL